MSKAEFKRISIQRWFHVESSASIKADPHEKFHVNSTSTQRWFNVESTYMGGCRAGEGLRENWRRRLISFLCVNITYIYTALIQHCIYVISTHRKNINLMLRFSPNPNTRLHPAPSTPPPIQLIPILSLRNLTPDGLNEPLLINMGT